MALKWYCVGSAADQQNLHRKGRIKMTITTILWKMAHYQSTLALHSALPWDTQEATHKHQFVMGIQVQRHASNRPLRTLLLMVFVFSEWYENIFTHLNHEFKPRGQITINTHASGNPHRWAPRASPAPPGREPDTRSQVRWSFAAHGSDGEKWMWGGGHNNSVADIINPKKGHDSSDLFL